LDRETILSNYQHVLDKVYRAAQLAGRSPDSIKVVVVTKGHPQEVVQAAIDVGIHVFGENYAEEGVAKIESCTSNVGLEWHMIGHVQSRKAKLVCEYFTFVHSLDRRKIADRLDRYVALIPRRLPVLLECNVSGEESKFGLPAWREENWSEILEDIKYIATRPNLELCGLMTMAPFLSDVELTRPYFIRLRRLKDYLAQEIKEVNWSELSMGMSADYEIAIEEGATIVRIGTAILGPRSRL